EVAPVAPANPTEEGDREARQELDHAALGKADEPPAPDHQVIVDTQVEEARTLDQLAGQPDIFTARRGVAARVVVEQDHRRGRLEDRGLEHVPRVHEARPTTSPVRSRGREADRSARPAARSGTLR